MILALAAALTAQAQVHDSGMWTAVLASPDVSDRARLWLDVHARRDGGSFLSIIRPGAGAQLSDRVSAWAGVAWIPTLPDDGAARHELRIWEQAIVNVPLGDRLKLQSRTRLEQRFAEGGGVGLRVREFVRLTVAPENPDRVRLALWDEVFVGLNETAGERCRASTRTASSWASDSPWRTAVGWSSASSTWWRCARTCAWPGSALRTGSFLAGCSAIADAAHSEWYGALPEDLP